MLKELHLQNFKCFEDHVLPLEPTTIIVGRNNAGKTTIVEALRLLSIIVGRYQSLQYSNVPRWLEIPRWCRGVSPSLRGMEFNFENVFHRYGDPPATITATFEAGETVTVYIGRDEAIHAVIADAKDKPVTSQGQARKLRLPIVSILPQVAPLARAESILNADYVRRALSSSLAPLHFRNQLNLFYGAFNEFKELAENTWPGLRMRELRGRGQLPEGPLSLLVQDQDFVAEVGLMGHGLQMWLQTIWFLARADKQATVILDEPDVYMHADLQRRLVRLVRSRYRQVIIATHSVEIISEVDPGEILVIDRRKRKSSFAASLPAVQSVIDNIGSAQNLQLARLWNARRCLLVEGKDIALLKHFQNSLFRDSPDPIDTLPNTSIGGWGGWNYAVGSSMLLKNAGGEQIVTYCILDSDYHTPDEIQERLADAMTRGVELHIWERKEIENYLLVPTAIHRFITTRIRAGVPSPEVVTIAEKMDEIAQTLRIYAIDQLAEQFYAKNKADGLPKANSRARSIVEPRWKSWDGRLSFVSGKEILSQLSKWSKDCFGVSFSTNGIAKELRAEEMAPELVAVITAVEDGVTFEEALADS